VIDDAGAAKLFLEIFQLRSNMRYSSSFFGTSSPIRTRIKNHICSADKTYNTSGVKKIATFSHTLFQVINTQDHHKKFIPVLERILSVQVQAVSHALDNFI
jgi:hypothetical protein